MANQDGLPEWAEELPEWAVEVPEDMAPAEPIAPPPPRDIGRVEAGMRGALQGSTLGWGDELVGAVESRSPSLSQTPGDFFADIIYPETIPHSRRNARAPSYEEARDAQRYLNEESREQNPKSYVAGELAGGFATSSVLPGNIVSNAVQGAAQGLGDSEAVDASGLGADAGVAAGMSAAGDAAGRVLGKYALPGLASRARKGLEGLATRQGNRALLDGSHSLTNRLPTSDDAVLQALEDEAIQMLGTSKGAFERLREWSKWRGDAYGTILEKMAALGVEGPRAKDLAERFLEEYNDRYRNSGGNKAVANVFKREARNVENITPSEFSLPGIGEGPARERLGLMQAERVKRSLQDEPNWSPIWGTLLNDAKQDVSKIYRKSIEDVVEQAGLSPNASPELMQLTEEFMPVKQRLARTLEAREAAKAGAARSANRSAIDLPSWIMAAGQDGAAKQGLTALLISQMRQRGASTVARGAYLGSRAAANAANMSRMAPKATQELMARLGSVPARQSSDWLKDLVNSDPEALGEYGPVLAAAAQRGPEALAVNDYVLSQKDPEYRRRKEEAQKAALGQQ